MSYLDFPALRPIRHLLVDPTISEIMINGVGQLFVERGGKIEAVQLVFGSQQQLEACVEGLVGLTGRAVNARSPFVDFRLPDGARVNVVIPPIALGGPVVTIRRASAAGRLCLRLADAPALQPLVGADHDGQRLDQRRRAEQLTAVRRAH